ncbi:hypothetical protein GWA97_10365 [Flavobacterium sp. LaA7.5]|nr:hypothetical protein [Flavobacterium salilacus subsp. altitudinum]
MKKSTLLLFAFIAIVSFSCDSDDDSATQEPVNEDVCKYESGVTLKTQQEVDEFAAFQACALGGELVIGNPDGESDITSLAGLGNLIKTGGQLKIINNPNLESLEGLENLTSIDGEIHIVNNPSLTNIDELSNIEKVVDVIEITDNESLLNIDGFQLLTEITSSNDGRVTIRRNPVLNSLTGLGGITKLREINISECPSLTSVYGLHNLNSLEIFDISHCPGVVSISDLSNLSSVSDVSIINTGLTSLEGLDNITDLYIIKIVDNPLSSLSGLENLTEVGTISIINCQSFNSLAGLNTAVAIDFIHLESLPSLLSLQDFSNLEDTEMSIDCIDNDALISLEGLEHLTVLNSVKIANNDSLTSLYGLHNVIIITEGLDISGNSQLTDLEYLSSLTALGHPHSNTEIITTVLSVSSNEILESLNGIQNIQNFYGGYTIRYNPNLRDLCAIIEIQQNANVFGGYGSLFIMHDNYNTVSPQTLSGDNCSVD